MYPPLLGLAALLVLTFSLGTKLALWREESGHFTQPAGGFMAAVMGDSRRLFANHFFSKADAYLHSGVYPSIFEQAPAKLHLAEAAESHSPSEPAVDSHEEDAHQEHSEDSSRPRDWIEAFGRNFAPRGHRHADESGKAGEVLPWIRFAADLNPNQVETYTVGAFWLRSRMGKVKEAESFLREGWRANPDSYEILLELGRLYKEDYHKADRARTLFELALRAWNKSERPREKPDKFGLMQIVAQLARVEEDAGESANAILHLEMLRDLSPHPEVIQGRIDALRNRVAIPVNAGLPGGTGIEQQN